MYLVVGGAGYVGSHVCKALRQARIPYAALDNLERGHRRALHRSPLLLGDIRKPGDLDRAFTEFDIQLVLHFAAYAEVGESRRDPAKYYENNVLGTFSLLEAMRRHGVSAIVFSSTAAVYGEPETVPIPEDHALRPVNPYGETKLAAERMLADYSNAYGLRYATLRYFNAAGADPEGKLGEDHRPETHLIPLVLRAALDRSQHVTIFGEDWPTPDGTCVRDYVHVSDLARAHIAAGRLLLEGRQVGPLNLGTGVGCSVRQVIDAAREVTGMDIPFKVGPRREGDPAQLVAAAGRAGEVLGWRPERSDLRTTVEDAWRWLSAHPDGYES